MENKLDESTYLARNFFAKNFDLSTSREGWQKQNKFFVSIGKKIAGERCVHVFDEVTTRSQR